MLSKQRKGVGHLHRHANSLTLVFRSTAHAERMPFEAGHGRNVDVDVVSGFIGEFSRFVDHQMNDLDDDEEAVGEKVNASEQTCEGRRIASMMNVSPCLFERDLR